MDNILNWWNTCNLKYEDKLSIVLLQLNNKKDSKIYKDTKEFLELLNK